jgi:hypothetical protein
VTSSAQVVRKKVARQNNKFYQSQNGAWHYFQNGNWTPEKNSDVLEVLKKNLG